MREVEVKYHVQDRDALLVALKARGIDLSAPVTQDDQAYAPVTWSYGDSKLGVSFVRLRTVDGNHTFTLKRPAENALSCDEYETGVADREQMHSAILAMGFRATVRITKVRRTATLPDLELCVDEVAGLGTFLELERMVSDGVAGDAVQAELAAFVASLDVEAVRTDETYDSLVRAASREAVVDSRGTPGSGLDQDPRSACSDVLRLW
ncbi:class IV adenylate cyclase [Sphaerisporangium rubeum]|uniref:Adenylate cyclase class 2 n=1 Tax=Sphaerisporangium rubeum TaxID=321317 RepID=A0A7X0IGR4_9ACTN|nr:adenylate cyclase class 2 [Sphaerisporangium rubeum]